MGHRHHNRLKKTCNCKIDLRRSKFVKQMAFEMQSNVSPTGFENYVLVCISIVFLLTLSNNLANTILKFSYLQTGSPS